MDKRAVSVFMDVEDPINPLADDAALDLARLFTAAGVRGSFCLTGEKCRTLLARGRKDVIEAYKPHCLGLHTDTHSKHPTTMELLETATFEEGCQLAYESERKGFDTFVQAFERPPVFWGGAGNTWSPEITDALKRLGIQTYSYALTALPDDGVHRFNGVVALPQALSISETDWSAGTEASDKVLKQLREAKQPWIGIFVGHPTKFRHREYWDTPYMAGRTPSEPEFVEPLPDQVYERSKENLAAFLDRLRSEAKIIGVDEALALSWKFRPPTQHEVEFFRAHTERGLRGAAKWPVHRPGLDPARIIHKTLALDATLEVAEAAS